MTEPSVTAQWAAATAPESVIAAVLAKTDGSVVLLQFGPGMPQEGRFWSVFWPAVTANVGYWATLSLNIPDFSR
jgi:cytosine/uracil/thiamine/allantoin permease